MEKDLKWFLDTIDDPQNQQKLQETLAHLMKEFPQLKLEIKWNQPMLTDHCTFILGFSASKHHFSVSPEQPVITRFSDEIEAAGYTYSKMLFRIKWTDPIDLDLLSRIIRFNIEEKKDATKFWREAP